MGTALPTAFQYFFPLSFAGFLAHSHRWSDQSKAPSAPSAELRGPLCTALPSLPWDPLTSALFPGVTASLASPPCSVVWKLPWGSNGDHWDHCVYSPSLKDHVLLWCHHPYLTTSPHVFVLYAFLVGYQESVNPALLLFHICWEGKSINYFKYKIQIMSTFHVVKYSWWNMILITARISIIHLAQLFSHLALSLELWLWCFFHKQKFTYRQTQRFLFNGFRFCVCDEKGKINICLFLFILLGFVILFYIKLINPSGICFHIWCEVMIYI